MLPNADTPARMTEAEREALEREVDEIREYARQVQRSREFSPESAHSRAATYVIRLLAHLDAVRGERDYAQNIATMHLATIDTLTRERDEARRENERLKAAIDSDGSLAADGDFDAYLGIAIDGAHALDTLPTIVERQDKEIRSLQKQLAASPPVTAPPERAPGEREALETALTAVRPQLLDMHYYAMGEYADTHPALQDRIEDDVDAVLDNIRSAFAAHQERANTPAALTRAGAGGEGDENIQERTDA